MSRWGSRVIVGGEDVRSVVEPKNSAPATDDYGLPVRVIGGSSGGGASTIADGADVTEGNTTDSAVVTDTTGTISGKLRGLVKILADVWDSGNHVLKTSLPSGAATSAKQDTGNTSLASIDTKLTSPLHVDDNAGSLTVDGSVSVSNFPATQPVSIADGSSVVEGSTTDVAVTGDTAGTVSAKLRGLSKILNDVWDSVNSVLKINVARFGGTAVTIGQKVAAQSMPVVLPSTTNVPVIPGTTGFDVTQTLSSSITVSSAASSQSTSSSLHGRGIVLLKASSSALVAGTLTIRLVAGGDFVNSTPPIWDELNQAWIFTGQIPFTSLTTSNAFIIFVAGATTVNLLSSGDWSGTATFNVIQTSQFDPHVIAETNLAKVGGSAITEGQKAMAASLPVVVASDQSILPVADSAAESSLATLAAKDFATSAKQDTGNTSLASIDTKLTSPLSASISNSPRVYLLKATGDYQDDELSSQRRQLEEDRLTLQEYSDRDRDYLRPSPHLEFREGVR